MGVDEKALRHALFEADKAYPDECHIGSSLWAFHLIEAYAAAKAPVSLEKCARILQTKKGKIVNNFFTGSQDLHVGFPIEVCREDVKTVLDAAGVKYE